jgi:hypothetical protein
VHLEASTKPHVHQKFEIFWTNIVSTMACANSKDGPKNGLRSLGIKLEMVFEDWRIYVPQAINSIPWSQLEIWIFKQPIKFVGFMEYAWLAWF